MVSFGKKYFVESKKGDVWLRAVFVRSADPGLVGLGESGRRAGARDRNAARSARPTDADDPPAPSARHRTRDGARRGAPHADVAPEKNKEDDNTCRAESHRRMRSRSADTTPPSSSPAIGGRLRGQRGFTLVKLWEIAGKVDRHPDLGCSARAFADLARASRRHGGVRPEDA